VIIEETKRERRVMKHVYQKNKNVSYGYLITCLFLLIIVILFSENVCAGGDEAFFIDEKGNVGIGTNEPKAALDVNGKVIAHELEVRGDINSAGTVKVKKIAGDGSALTVWDESIILFLVPKGGIIAWYPGEQYVEKRQDGKTEIKAPEGWAICDGSDGTPDLTNRFIRGTRSADDAGKTGGTEEHNHKGATGIPSSKFKKGSTSLSRWTSPHTDHRHAIEADTNLPPYIFLVYIMKL
jgi:hypothetical protein